MIPLWASYNHVCGWVLETCDGEPKQRAVAVQFWAAGQCGKSQNCPSAFSGYAPCLYNLTEPLRFPILGFEELRYWQDGDKKKHSWNLLLSQKLWASHLGIFLSVSYWAFCLPAIETDAGRAGYKLELFIIRAKGTLPGPSLLPGWLWRPARGVPAAFLEKLKGRRPTGPMTQTASVQKRVRTGQAGPLSIRILWITSAREKNLNCLP